MTQPFETKQRKRLDEKYCSECGEIIKIKAEICPQCGVRQSSSEKFSKTALLLLTFFLGGIGGHKFYIGKNWQGFFYLIFCWTAIPGLIALVEYIIYIFTSSEVLEEKYSAKGNVVIIVFLGAVGVFGFIAFIGIVAAIAIPQFAAYRERAIQVSTESIMQDFALAEEKYFIENGKYSADLLEMDFSQTIPEIHLKILSADSNCYEAVGTHDQLEEPFLIDCNTYRE